MYQNAFYYQYTVMQRLKKKYNKQDTNNSISLMHTLHSTKQLLDHFGLVNSKLIIFTY